jgi:hypothetical protein
MNTVRTGRLFHGDDLGCKAFLAGQPIHYVYILRRPDGRAFYVGKGYGLRVFQHENEARHPNNRLSNAYKLNVIRSIWEAGLKLTYEIDLVTTSAEEAYAREAALIGLIKRLHEGGPRTNLAAGGGSSAGPAPASAKRHVATLGGIPDDNPERATLNGFVLSIASMDSVVVKPVGQFIARPTVRFSQQVSEAVPAAGRGRRRFRCRARDQHGGCLSRPSQAMGQWRRGTRREWCCLRFADQRRCLD